MALIKSISGIRGTIGGKQGTGLTPPDIVRFTTAYAAWVNSQGTGKKIVVGRDGRISGEIVRNLVVATLQSAGFDVLDVGLSTTPTVEMAVVMEKAAGGIILTASHNPKEWNALKLLNEHGEFISAEAGQWILDYAAQEEYNYAEIQKIGSVQTEDSYIDKHIAAILAHPLVDASLIKQKKFKIVVDAISIGSTPVKGIGRRRYHRHQ
jgi:phosphomannomutase